MRNIEEWRELIFKTRNPPRGAHIRELRREYRNFITYLDSRDLISGPICSNQGVTNIEEITYIKYDREIPFQYSFKDTIINILNQFLVTTIFFKQT